MQYEKAKNNTAAIPKNLRIAFEHFGYNYEAVGKQFGITADEAKAALIKAGLVPDFRDTAMPFIPPDNDF